ncbi:MAG: hypothetical protein EA424_04055 [Planctomycetaceae bacterium]|nr:MAG: hypothetical protein EA424_04055 [Planctomycetaceae bacterium]
MNRSFFCRDRAGVATVALLMTSTLVAACHKPGWAADTQVAGPLAAIADPHDRLRLALGIMGLEDAVVIGCQHRQVTLVSPRISNPHRAGQEAWLMLGSVLGVMDRLGLEGTLLFVPVYQGSMVSGVAVPVDKVALLQKGTVEGYHAFRQAMTPLRIAAAGDAWFRTKNVSATGQVAGEELRARLQQSLEQIQQRYDLIASQVDAGRYESAERNIRLLEQALPAVGQLVAQVVAGGEPCQLVLTGLPTDAAMTRIRELEHHQQESSGQSAEAIAQQLKMLEPVEKLDAMARSILVPLSWANWLPSGPDG